MSDNLIDQLVLYVTVSERLSGCVRQATTLVGEMRRVFDADPSLAPELQTCVDLSGELVQALARAHEFAQTRIEVAAGLDGE